MFKEWELFKERLDNFYSQYMHLKNIETPDIILKIEKEKIDTYLFKDRQIKEILLFISKKFSVDIPFLKSIFLPDSNIFNLSKEEIVDRFKYYINLFGNKEIFFKIIKQETIYQAGFYSVKTGLFSWEDKKEATNQLENIAKLFNLTKKQAILFAVNNVYYFDLDITFIKKKMQEYADILDTSTNVIKEICKVCPSAFYSRVARLQEKIVGFSKSFELDENIMKKMMLKYPPMIEYQITQIRQISKLLKSYSKNFTNTILNFPQIVDFIDIKSKSFIGDFDNLQQIERNLRFVFTNIGEIINVYNFKSNPCLMVKKFNGKFCIICLGLKTKKIKEELLKNYFHYDNEDWSIVEFKFSLYDINKNESFGKILENIEFLKE